MPYSYHGGTKYLGKKIPSNRDTYEQLEKKWIENVAFAVVIFFEVQFQLQIMHKIGV